MKGIPTSIASYRRQVFSEVAKFAFEQKDISYLENIPYTVVPGERSLHRESIFLERAIVGERVRLALGLPLRKITEHAAVSAGISENLLVSKYYEGAFVNIIKFACNACPDNVYKVSDICRGCLAHPCTIVCPKNAISIRNGKSVIDQDKCIKCGKCMKACPYGAIHKLERPCAKSCGMDAIGSDDLGRAHIDYDKCVSCGVCISNCPFGAIADKSQIYQVISALNRGEKVIAEIAPAFVGQFGDNVSPEMLKDAIKRLGFYEVNEVAVGADLCTIEEAKDFMENVPEKLDFLATSCCPAWSVMAKKMFPEIEENISMAMTPMVLAARLIKKDHPDAKVVFIGPCVAKKLEASRSSVKSHVDYVLTFEEMMGLFIAKGINLEDPETEQFITDGTAGGRGFAISGGVANAVKDVLKEMAPDLEVKIDAANGLKECRTMLAMAKAGKRKGYLLEGMACPGGCIAGTGTIQPVAKSQKNVKAYSAAAERQVSTESIHASTLPTLESEMFDNWEIDWDK